MLFDEIEVFYEGVDGLAHFLTGLDHPYDSRPISYRFFSFPVDVDAGEQKYVYFRVKSGHFPLLVPWIGDEAGFALHVDAQNSLTNLIIGIMVGTFLYLVLLVISTREYKTNLPYLIFLFFATADSAIQAGCRR